MTAKTLVLPTSKTSKIDEIQFLRDLAASMKDTSTYLSDFFTKELVDWAIQKIVDDCAPDIWDLTLFLQHQKDEEMKQARMIIADRGDEITNANRQIEKLNARIENYILVIAGKESIIENCKNACEKAYLATAEVCDARDAALVIIATKQQELDDAQQTIIELKAKLYDLVIGSQHA